MGDKQRMGFIGYHQNLNSKTMRLITMTAQISYTPGELERLAGIDYASFGSLNEICIKQKETNAAHLASRTQ